MDNSSYRSRYIDERFHAGEIAEKTANEIRKCFIRIENAENRYGKRIEDGMTREDFLSLFNLMKIGKIYYFKNLQAVMSGYLRWLDGLGVIHYDPKTLLGIKFQHINQTHVFDTRYYKDFQSLQNKIDEGLRVADRVDDRIFATQIALIYLAWCGVKIEDAVQIKKTDVHDGCVEVGDTVIRPNAKIMDFLTEYRDASGYESQARSVITLKYLPSVYLLRTTRIDRLTPKLVSFLLASFSKSASGDDDDENRAPAFAYAKIYWSGVFQRAYLYECINGTIQKGDMETISRVFGESYNLPVQANYRLADYIAYRNHFFPSYGG